MADNLPTCPPTWFTEEVRTRTKKGPTAASKVNGTKNRNAEARMDPVANLNFRQP